MMALHPVYDEREVDLGLVAVCGMYCGACPVYRAWVEQDAPRLQALAKTLRADPATLMCTGCRAPPAFCLTPDCEVKRCAESKELFFCGECDEFPCEKIKRLEVRGGRCAAIEENAARLRDVGWYAWLREQDARWRCPSCRAKVGFDEAKCPACGHRLEAPATPKVARTAARKPRSKK